jgi:hypothetical protein
MNFYICQNVGVSGTTRVVTLKIQEGGRFGDSDVPDVWEARVGIAILGYSAPTTTQESNPFDGDFQDNFARGFGTSEEAAVIALKLDLKRTADSLWE